MYLSPKDLLRKSYLNKRRALAPEEIKNHSQEICAKLLNLLADVSFQSIACYYHTLNEPNLTMAMEQLRSQHKTVYLPRFDEQQGQYLLAEITDLKHDLTMGKYGILEPKASCPSISILQAKQTIQIWLVPGLAFDKEFNRLGFGKGYYDNFLTEAVGQKIGIGYTWQLANKPLPTHSSDIKMDQLILS